MPQMLDFIIDPRDMVNKGYVDKCVAGTLWDPVDAAADIDQALTGTIPLVIDTITLTQGQRVVLTGQTDPTQNGIYAVSITDDAWTLERAPDASDITEYHSGKSVYVIDGNTYGHSLFILTSTVATLGDDPIEFMGITSSNSSVNSSFVGTMPGDGHASQFTIDHGLDTKNIIVQTYDEVTGARVICDVVTPDNNTAVITTAEVMKDGEVCTVVIISADIRVAGKSTSSHITYDGNTPALEGTVTSSLDVVYNLAHSKVALNDIPLASTTADGLMSSTDKTKVNNAVVVTDLANYYTKAQVDTQMSGKAGTAVATTLANGLMSASDKTAVNNIPGTISTALGSYYTKAQVDTQMAGKASTAVATTSAAGLMSATDKIKLNSALTSTDLGNYYTKLEVDTQMAGKASTAAATTSAAGLMSATDKTAVNNIPTTIATALNTKITYGTTDLTAGSSTLTTGNIYLVYE